MKFRLQLAIINPTQLIIPNIEWNIVLRKVNIPVNQLLREHSLPKRPNSRLFIFKILNLPNLVEIDKKSK